MLVGSRILLKLTDIDMLDNDVYHTLCVAETLTDSSDDVGEHRTPPGIRAPWPTQRHFHHYNTPLVSFLYL